MEYIKILTIFAGIVTTIITFVFTTRAINYIAWRFREKIDKIVNKRLIADWERECDNNRINEINARINTLEDMLWEIKNKNKNKRSK